MNTNDNDLAQAARTGNETLLQSILRHPDCQPLAANEQGLTALMQAAFHGHHSCVQILFSCSNALAEDNYGRTALMHAGAQGHVLCVQSLLLFSHALTRDHLGRTALMVAASGGHTTCVQILLPVSAVEARDVIGATARTYARSSHNSRLTVALIDSYILALREASALELTLASTPSSRNSTFRL